MLKVFSLTETRIDTTTKLQFYHSERQAIFQMAYKVGQIAQIHPEAVVFPNDDHSVVDIWKDANEEFQFIANFTVQEVT